MLKVLEPTYFPPISHWKHISSNNLQWSINSSYNKQTLTNRTYIDSSNGELMLTVPIKHSGKNVPRKFSEIKIDNSSNWKKTHYKSIKICYQSSPFFEFYEDDISFFYESDYEYLHQLSYTIDFQRDVKNGDTIELLYEANFTKNDAIVGKPLLLYGLVRLNYHKIEFILISK